MKKSILLITALLLIFCVTCAQEKAKVDANTIDTVAKIAAMLEINEGKAVEMLEEAEITMEQYKETITKITLDAKSTNVFVEKKNSYIDEFKK